MKKLFLLVLMLVVAAGCATTKKQFSVVVEPPDAEITVIPGGDLPVQKAKSPANITVQVPADQDLADRGRIEIKLDAYKPKILGLSGIENGQKLTVKLEKMVHYVLKLRLAGPIPSDDLQYRDRVITASFTFQERQFEMTVQNVSGKPLKILWARSQYLDHVNKNHRLMHSNVRPQDRNNDIPSQTINPDETVTEGVLPVTSVVYSPSKHAYESKLLMPVDSDIAAALKGRFVYLFLPMEMDRQIIPYNFKFQIVDVVKDL